MRDALNQLEFDGTVVIGEGERDEAPMLFIGEKVGSAQGSGPRIDIALDPLEGTTITAKAGPNALAVLAIAEEGNLLNAPDVYMDKLAIGPGYPQGTIDLSKSPTDNVRAIAAAKGVDPSEIIVCVLDRPRHAALIAELRSLGCGINLIPDGDVAGVIAVTDPDTTIDVYMGQGGAPEGVLAAAALRCVGGQFQGRLVFRNDDERARAAKWGVTELDRIYRLEELAQGDVIFAATGVRSEEHTSELQSRQYLVCRLLLEKKKKQIKILYTEIIIIIPTLILITTQLFSPIRILSTLSTCHHLSQF